MTKVKFFIVAVCFLCVEKVASQEKYNVLFLLVDDLRPSLGAYGDSFARSPHIDSLAKQAYVFHKAYANQAVCVASRYNLLLGSRSTSTGIYDFGRNFRDYYPTGVTMPEYFKSHGYYTAAIGKVFHVGHNTYNDSQSWSVPHDHDLVIEYADKSHVEFTREEALFANKGWDEANQLPKGAAWECLDVADETYADGRVAKKAMDRLKELRKKDQPFFLAVGFARPHLPFSVPQKYWNLYNAKDIPMPLHQVNPVGSPQFANKRDGEIEQYKEIPHSKDADPFPEGLTRKLIHGYYAGVSYVDTQIGKVLDVLQETGLDKNTIVVLWGDHGYLLGEMGMWTKHVNHELANRIPLVVRLPGMMNNVGSEALMETVDIYPTLVELCGLGHPNPQQPFDGKSFAGYLKYGEKSPRKYIYHCFPRGGRLGLAIRDDRHRLVAWTSLQDESQVEYELYDYKDGLIETKNIWKKNHPAFIKLKSFLDGEPTPVIPRPESIRH